MRRASVLVLLAAALGACGGGDEEFPSKPRVQMLGNGPDRVWVFTPAGEPKSLVIYLHGQGGPVEATPVNHRPWIDHLVDRGNVVVYPRYEVRVERNPMVHLLNGVQTAVKRHDLDRLPVLAIGYSRGGALAIEYAAIARIEELPVPDAIMSVFPASRGEVDTEIDFTPLESDTILLLLVGDRDDVVREDGARLLLGRLQAGGFPPGQILWRSVRSTGTFVADHFAPLQTTPAARAAFWQPADRLIGEIRKG
jgi:hypothetical protein